MRRSDRGVLPFFALGFVLAALAFDEAGDGYYGTAAVLAIATAGVVSVGIGLRRLDGGLLSRRDDPEIKRVQPKL